MSEYLAHTSEAAYAVTLLATPSGDNCNDWICNKIKGAMVGLACVGMSEGITRGIQEATHRHRPNKLDYLGFPSTHTSNTSTFNTLASRNINYVSIPPRAAVASQVILYLVTTSTAWARVEAKQHYPSDVLVGMALGNFLGSFMNDAFLGLGAKNAFLTCEPSKKGVAVGLHWLF
jgi:membrane-associated phospholipid phosphatase